MNQANPLEPPTALVSDSHSRRLEPRPLGLLCTAVLQTGAAVLMAKGVPAVLPQFAKVFGVFSVNAHAGTRLVLANPRLWWVFVWVGGLIAAWTLVRWNITQTELRRMKLAVYGFTALFAVAVVLGICALYWPMFAITANT